MCAVTFLNPKDASLPLPLTLTQRRPSMPQAVSPSQRYSSSNPTPYPNPKPTQAESSKYASGGFTIKTKDGADVLEVDGKVGGLTNCFAPAPP
jgi:hypothetical protein